MKNRISINNHIFGFLVMLFLMTACLAGCGSFSDGENAASIAISDGQNTASVAIPDGEYTATVTMTGGTGKAYIESPCAVTISSGNAKAEIVWSSPNYDYMIVGGQTYYPVNAEGNSKFVIPIVPDQEIAVSADTVAMSTPHLIDYTLTFSIQNSDSQVTAPENTSTASEPENTIASINYGEELRPPEIPGLTYIETDENTAAVCFRIHRYSDGFSLISVYDGRKYLIIPEGKSKPEGISTIDTTFIHQPLRSIYLAASGSMCHFDSIGAIPSIVLSGIQKDGWYIDAAQKAMGEGTLEYGGKYSAPDYEKIIDKGVDLAIENTMILHTPKVLEKLESLGIPVFIDRSNYEEDPLGRCEWIRVYGLLTGKEEEAARAFDKQLALINALGVFEDSEKSVVVFSINANHVVYVKLGNDYFAKMIEMAGGTYLSPEITGNGGMSSQTSVTMEAFYDYAAGADILIYNSTIEDAPSSVDALVATDSLFADFKAVQDGNVWCTHKSMYQFADQTGTIIDELNGIISSKEQSLQFFHKLP